MRLRRDAKTELIARVPLFAHCSKRELAEIASIADEIHFPAGKTLIREGQRGREFFVLVEGVVDVTKEGETIATARDGDFLGEIALVTDVPRTATVTTTTDIRLLVVTDRDFQRLLREAPGIQSKVMRALAERVAQHEMV